MRNITFLWALLCLNTALAQSPGFRSFSTTSGSLGLLQSMPTNAIADDFGPRNLAKTYWHGGVDFNTSQGAGEAQRWWMVVSPQAGVIADFDHLTHAVAAYKYGLVNVMDEEGNGSHTWLFGHVFDNNAQFYDKFNHAVVLNRCEVPNEEKWGLHLRMTDENGQVISKTYGQVNGAIFKVNGVDHTTTNIVNTTDPFLPLGNSGNKGSNFPVHLHLNTLPYNTEITGSLPTSPNGDPAQFLDIDRPQYELSVRTEANANELAFVYPGTNSTKVRVRTQMQGEPLGVNRYSKLMDMDKVELQIKKATSGTFERIKGDQIEAIISEGGRLGEPHINHSNPVNKSDWQHTGVHSNAYNGDNSGDNARNPWDDYYFTDFKTRIHKNDAFNDKTIIADVPTNCRYSDGAYEFRVKTTTSNNGVNYSTVQNVILDNFKPYISFAGVRYGGAPIYQIDRISSEGDTKINGDGTVSNQPFDYASESVPNGTHTLSIEITTSEPMQNVKMSFVKEPLTFFTSGVNMIQDSNNKLRWTGNITTVFGTGDCFKVRFSGQDLSGNEIINIYNNTGGNDKAQSVKIPTRKGTGTGSSAWNHPPAGGSYDQIDFCIKDCDKRIWSGSNTARRGGDDVCNTLSLISSTVLYTSCIQATIVLGGAGFNPSDFTIRWTDAQGNPLTQYNNMAMIDVRSAGMYCFEVEAIEDCCNIRGCAEVLPSMMEDAAFDLSADITHSCTRSAYDGKIDLHIEGGAAPFQVDWDIISQYTTTQIQSNSNVFNGSGDEDLSGIPAGNYAVVVTDQHGCSRTAYYEIINNGITVTVPAAITVCQPGAGVIIPEVSGGTGIYTYAWSTGETEDGLYGLDEGTYSVTVTDESGCSAEASENVIIKQSKIWLSTSKINVCGNGSGSVSLQIDGGAKPYDYSWSNGADTHSITGLAAGVYTVTVTDQAGCSAVQEAEISDKGFEILLEVVDCHTINARIWDGKPPYKYKWSTGDDTPTINVTQAGAYTVTVTDAAMCEKIKSINFHQEHWLNVSSDITPDICNTGNGRISISLNNKCDIKWLYPINKAETGYYSAVENLMPGVYIVELNHTGNPECKVQKAFNVKNSENFKDIFYTYAEPALCSNQGKIQIGTKYDISPATIKYKWNTGSEHHEISNLPAAIYSVTATINDKCTFTSSIEIHELSGRLSASHPNCGQSNGSLSWSNPEKELDNFSILWSTGHTTTSVLDLPAGQYAVTVSEGGCIRTFTPSLDEENSLEDYGAKIVHTCENNQLTYTIANDTNLPPDALIEWKYTESGKTPVISNDKSITFSYPENEGLLLLNIFDNSCPINKYSTIIKKINQVDILPPLSCDGVNISGALSVSEKRHLAYLWSTGNTSNKITISDGGTYTVTITDDKCAYTVTSGIVQPGDFKIYTTGLKKPDSYCDGGGFIKVGSNMDVYNVQYKWGASQTGNEIGGLYPGNYSVTATLGPCEQVLTYELCSCHDCIEDFWPNYEYHPATCQTNNNITVATILPSHLDSYDGQLSVSHIPENYVFSWYYMNEQGQYEFLSSAKTISFLKSGIYKLIWNNGCDEHEKIIKLLSDNLCNNPLFGLNLINEPCINGNILVKPVNATGSIYYEISTSYPTFGLPNQVITIPVNNRNKITITAYDLESGCKAVMEINIDKIFNDEFSVDIPLRDLEPCTNGFGSAWGHVNGNNLLFSRWLFNGMVVSNNAYLTYSESGTYTFEAYNKCGVKVSKSIKLSCDCKNQKFPNILHYSPCFDYCDSFEKIFEGSCSSLKLAANCEAQGLFDVVWPNLERTTVSNCDILSGDRFFYPKNEGENMQVIMKSSEGCVKASYFTFNEPWCVSAVNTYWGIINGYLDYEGSCGEPVSIKDKLPTNKNVFELNPVDYSKPCEKGVIRRSSKCNKTDVSPINIDLKNTQDKIIGIGSIPIDGNCILCIYQDENNYQFRGDEFGAKYCPENYCPDISIKYEQGKLKIRLNSPFNLKDVKFVLRERCGYIDSAEPFYIENINIGINNFEHIYTNGCQVWIESEIVYPSGKTCKIESNKIDNLYALTGCDDIITSLFNTQDGNLIYCTLKKNDEDTAQIICTFLDSTSHQDTLHLSVSEEIVDVRKDASDSYFVLFNSGNIRGIKKFSSTGLLVWTLILDDYELYHFSGDFDTEYEILAYENSDSSFVTIKFDDSGQAKEIDTLNIPKEFYKVLYKNKGIVAGLMEDNIIMLSSSSGIVTEEIPKEITVKDIKTSIDGNIVVAGEFKGILNFDDKYFDSKGYNNAIFLLYDKGGAILGIQSVQNFRDEFISGIALDNNNRIAFHGKYVDIDNVMVDSLVGSLDSCTFIHIISLDTITCTTFTSELTFDQELCELSWDNVPEGYTTPLEYISNDSIWISALPNDGNDGFITPYRISRDATYRLTHQKAGCPDMASNELVATCGPVTCPVVSLMYDDEEDNDRCYIYQIQHGDNQKFKFIIRTWLVDTTALQFTDTVTFTIGDTTDTFSYCDLPEQYRCYNHGDMRIICTSCDTSCQLYYDSWSCIPRTDTKDALLQTGKNIYYYPNPFAGGIYLHFLSVADDNMTITVYNSQGGEALQNQIQMKTGENVHYLKAFEKLSPGIYTVHLKGKDRIYTSKVVKIQ